MHAVYLIVRIFLWNGQEIDDSVEFHNLRDCQQAQFVARREIARTIEQNPNIPPNTTRLELSCRIN